MLKLYSCIVFFSPFYVTAAAERIPQPLPIPISSLEIKEIHKVPPQWAWVARAPSDHIVDLQIGLKQSQMEELERHLIEGRNNSTQVNAVVDKIWSFRPDHFAIQSIPLCR